MKHEDTTETKTIPWEVFRHLLSPWFTTDNPIHTEVRVRMKLFHVAADADAAKI